MGALSARKVRLILICEDSAHESLVRRFLSLAGWPTRLLEVNKQPPGFGSGEQWVRERLVSELELYWRKRNHVNYGIIAVTDWDTVDRLAQLKSACEARGVRWPGPGERLLIVTPARNVETWARYLLGEIVDEYAVYPKVGNLRLAAEALWSMCQSGRLREPAPKSLVQACEDFSHFRHALP